MEKNDIKDIVDRFEEQEWITRIAESTQSAIGAAFESGGEAGQQIKNFLHGTWMGHALHPAMTDVPIGAWTAALVLDGLDAISGRDDFSKGADAAIGVGLIGATGAAVTGMADYQASGKQSPNAGLVHGVLNTGAAALYVTSLLLRRRGSRTAGRIAALLGYGVMSASAYLGGELVYGKKIGVDHGERDDLPGEWTRVLSLSELPLNQLKRVEVNDIKILLLRRDDRIYAIGEVCSHLGGPLADGDLECSDRECSVSCPWHGSRFDLATGEVLDGPATYPQPLFETRVLDEEIEIKIAESRAAQS